MRGREGEGKGLRGGKGKGESGGRKGVRGWEVEREGGRHCLARPLA